MRSAIGSRTLPSSLPWSKWRAIQPSTQSVAPRTAEQHRRREQLVVGEQPEEERRARRAATSEMTFGSVTIRDPRSVAHRANRTRSIQSSPAYAPPSTGIAVPVTKDAGFRAQERRDPPEVRRVADAPRRGSRPRRIELAAVERPDPLGVVEARAGASSP